LNATRHQAKPLSPTAAARLADVRADYDWHRRFVMTQRESLAALKAAGTKTDCSAMLREMRFQVALCVVLSNTIARLELEARDAAVDSEPNPFDEFEPKLARFIKEPS